MLSILGFSFAGPTRADIVLEQLSQRADLTQTPILRYAQPGRRQPERQHPPYSLLLLLLLLLLPRNASCARCLPSRFYSGIICSSTVGVPGCMVLTVTTGSA